LKRDCRIEVEQRISHKEDLRKIKEHSKDQEKRRKPE
jgi:hypothetical protein